MRILLADDNPDMCELFQVFVKDEGWIITCAADGHKALLAYHMAAEMREPFDVLLLDVAMPRLNGFTVGINVRNVEKYGDVPRAYHIYFTGHEDLVDSGTLTAKAEADYCFIKPPDFDELKRILRTQLKKVEA
jgi:DNA-binding response OmpR family regulator